MAEFLITDPVQWDQAGRAEALRFVTTGAAANEPLRFKTAPGLVFLAGSHGLLEARAPYLGEDYSLVVSNASELGVAATGLALASAERDGKRVMDLKVNPDTNLTASLGREGLLTMRVTYDEEIAELSRAGVRFLTDELMHEVNRHDSI